MTMTFWIVSSTTTTSIAGLLCAAEAEVVATGATVSVRFRLRAAAFSWFTNCVFSSSFFAL